MSEFIPPRDADTDVDHWLTEQHSALVHDVAAVLDVEAGLREATLPAQHAALVADLGDVLDVEAGLAAIVPAPADSSAEPTAPPASPDAQADPASTSGVLAGHSWYAAEQVYDRFYDQIDKALSIDRDTMLAAQRRWALVAQQAFADLQPLLSPQTEAMREAQRRLTLLHRAVSQAPWVSEVVASGSMARSTEVSSLSDVDLLIVYDRSAAPVRQATSNSADSALQFLQTQITRTLGKLAAGTGEAWRVELGSRAVRCHFYGAPRPGIDRPFPVDLVPALRQPDGSLLIPERQTRRWIPTHPKPLLQHIQTRQEQWPVFVPLIRLLKFWVKVHNLRLEGLLVEILAVRYLDHGDPLESLARFFASAGPTVVHDLAEPTRHGEEAQRSSRIEAIGAAMRSAAQRLDEAVAARQQGDLVRASQELRAAFRPGIPAPRPEDLQDQSITEEIARLLPILEMRAA